MALPPAMWQLLGLVVGIRVGDSQFRGYWGYNFFFGANFSTTLSDTIWSYGQNLDSSNC